MFTAEHQGEAPIYLLLLLPGEEPRNFAEIHADDLNLGPSGTYFTCMSIQAPNEIYKFGGHISREVTQLTHLNDVLLSQIDMQPLESFTFKGANDEEVQGFMVKPPRFDPNKKYPLKFLIHGGPQGAWGNSWTYRWNAELFAAPSSAQSVGQDSAKSGTSPDGSTEARYQSKLAFGQWCHGRLRRRHDQFPRLDRLWAEVY